MSKWLFISITVVLLGLFGIVTYYGMQALQPHTYIPTEDTALPTTNTATTSLVLPTLPGLVPKPPTPKVLLSSEGPTPQQKEPEKILETEQQLAYLATSTIREINAEKLFFAPKESRAFPYGKADVFVLENPSSAVRTSLWTINTTTKTVTRVAGPAFGLMARWSKNGRYILTMSTDATRTLSISFIDTKTKSITPLRLATLPSKCFIMDSTPIMYCGILKGAREGTVLPDDYLKKKFISSDRIMKIDFTAPKVVELWDGESNSIDIENPALIGTDLFFTNRTDDSVWKLAL
mgnify:CR=1 FL=1